MKQLSLLFLTLLSWSDSLSAACYKAPPSKVHFNTTASFAEIKYQAKQECKPIFIEFYAPWCSPCEFMDETTFNDDNLSIYANRNYILYKVNTDDFEGYSVASQMDVKSLPTLLILNPQGIIIDRINQTQTAEKILDFLKKNNTPANGCGSKSPLAGNDAPTSARNNSTAKVDASNKVPLNAGVQKQTQKIIMPPSVPQAANTQPAVVERAAPAAATERRTPNRMPTTTGDGLYEFSVKKREAKGFSIQTNVFSQLAFVLREVEKLKRLYPNEPILVSVFTPEGKTEPNYRILVGVYSTEAQAEPMRATLKNSGIPSPTIKNLNQFAPK